MVNSYSHDKQKANNHLENHDVLLKNGQDTNVNTELQLCDCLLMPDFLAHPLLAIFALLGHTYVKT